MGKIHYTNSKKHVVHIGAVTIQPGDTREVEESHIPGYKPKEEPTGNAQQADALVELLKGNVKEVVAALAGLSAGDLDRLGKLEQQGQARKGILSAIADIQLTAAANADMLAKVAAFSDVELAAALEAVKTDINVDPDYLAALEAEAAKRNPGAAE